MCAYQGIPVPRLDFELVEKEKRILETLPCMRGH